MSPPHPSRRRRRTTFLALVTALTLSPVHTFAHANANASPWDLQPLKDPSYARLSVIGPADTPGALRLKNPHMNSAPLIGAHSEVIVPIVPIAGSGVGGGSSSDGLIGPNIIPQAADAVAGIVSPPDAVTSPQKAKGVDGIKLDLQTFTNALGGIKAPAIFMSNVRARPFQVGDDNFDDFDSAASKTCDVQRGRCNLAVIRENAATGSNRGNGKGPQRGGTSPRSAFTAVDCDQQKNQCEAAQRTAPIQTFNLENLGPDPNEPEFDLICMA